MTSGFPSHEHGASQALEESGNLLTCPLSLDLFEKQPFKQLPLLISQLSEYLDANRSQLHRYPEEEYPTLIKTLASTSHWPADGFFLARSAPEAFEYLLECVTAPGDTIVVSEQHPYRAVIERQCEIRGGQVQWFASGDSPKQTGLANAKILFLEDADLSETLLKSCPTTPVVLVNPATLQPLANVVHIFEFNRPLDISLSPTPPIFGFTRDSHLAGTVRKIVEPFHIPTHLLVMLNNMASLCAFPGDEITLSERVVEGILPEIDAIQPYVPGKGIKTMAREMGMSPQAFCKLASNEHPEGMRPETLMRLRSLLGEWQHSPVTYEAAANRLKEGIAESSNRTARISSLDMANIQLGTGSVELIKAAIKAFVPPTQSKKPGKVLFPEIPFTMYPFEAVKRLSQSVYLPLEKDRSVSIEKMAALIKKEQPQVVFLANPRNPLGTCVDNVDPLIEAITSEQVLILDEAYFHFARIEMGVDRFPDGARLLEQHPDKNIIVLRTFAKSHAMASFRLGYSIARPDLTQRLRDVTIPCNIDPVTLAAGIASMETPEVDPWIEATAHRVIQEKDRFYRLFEELNLPYLRSFSNFVYFETGSYPSKELFNALARFGVIIRPIFEGSCRVTAGNTQENDKFIDAMRKVYKNQG